MMDVLVFIVVAVVIIGGVAWLSITLNDGSDEKSTKSGPDVLTKMRMKIVGWIKWYRENW